LSATPVRFWHSRQGLRGTGDAVWFSLPLRGHLRFAFLARTVWFCSFDGIRGLPSGFMRCRCAFGFSLASAVCLRASCAGAVRLPFRGRPRYAFALQASHLCVCLFAGIRALPSCFTRRPCAGRHVLFFAAAKKSRQKKAANTANLSSCLRAPKGSYTSYGSISVRVRCQRFE
jgi:hypothetical protein